MIPSIALSRSAEGVSALTPSKNCKTWYATFLFSITFSLVRHKGPCAACCDGEEALEGWSGAAAAGCCHEWHTLVIRGLHKHHYIKTLKLFHLCLTILNNNNTKLNKVH